MPRRRLLWRLYPSYLLVTLLSLVAVTWYASDATRRFFRAQAAQTLEARAHGLQEYLAKGSVTAQGVQADALCKQMGAITGTRITLILPSGKVIGDSDRDPATMENHSDRPEIVQALAGGVGNSIRESPTLDIPMMYVAIAGHDAEGNPLIIRTAMSLAHVDEAVHSLIVRIAEVGIVAALVAALVCFWVSRRLARPIEEIRRGVERLARGDLSHRLHPPAAEELASLAEMFNDMAAQMEDRIRVITAQRNEQEAVFSSMLEGVLAVDTERRVLRMNHAAGRLLNADPQSSQGKPLMEVCRSLDLARCVSAALASAESTEGEFNLRDDVERWLQVHGAALQDAAGRRMGAVIVLNDVTRVRKLEAFRREFVANVSHELRTPITSIKGFVETLLDGAIREPDSAQKFLSIIERQVDRMNAIVGDLLLLSRLEQEADVEVLKAEETALRGVLERAVQLIRPKADARQVPIQIACDESLRVRINGPLIEQAITNLVDNAVKYSDPGKRVTVEAHGREGAVVIQVRDEGCGIDREHLPRIFERFYRVDKGRSRDNGGTGLGLAIVKHIAQAHGGSIAVESTPGKGSTFALTLPVR